MIACCARGCSQRSLPTQNYFLTFIIISVGYMSQEQEHPLYKNNKKSNSYCIGVKSIVPFFREAPKVGQAKPAPSPTAQAFKPATRAIA